MSTATNAVSAGDPVDTAAVLLRPLGAWERMYHRYMERNPMHFVLAMEFDTSLPPDRVQAALNAVQSRHPLLAAHIEDHPDTRLGFYRPAVVPAIPLTTLRQDPHHWQQLAAQELSRPFDRSVAPFLRAVLISAQDASTVLLTFDHTVADGNSAKLVLQDLVAALNQHQLDALPVPPSQEELIARVLPTPDELPLETPPTEDPRTTAPAALRPFDATLPFLHTVTLDTSTTARLLARCREEKTTVQGLIVAATARARGMLRGEDFLRVLAPFSFRELIGGGGCANYFASRRFGMSPHDGTGIWGQARTVSALLRDFTSVAGVVTLSEAVQQAIPVDADAHTAERFLTTASSYEVAITNLGVLRFDPSDLLRPTVVTGPMALFQCAGEQITGVLTYNGQLRLTTCAYTPPEACLDQVRETLSEV